VTADNDILNSVASKVQIKTIHSDFQ